MLEDAEFFALLRGQQRRLDEEWLAALAAQQAAENQLQQTDVACLRLHERIAALKALAAAYAPRAAETLGPMEQKAAGE